MKTTIDTLKMKAASPAVVTAVVVAMAVAGGGLKLPNHNETLLRDDADDEDGDAMKTTTDALKTKIASAAIASAVVALAASGGAWSAMSMNHNETLLPDEADAEADEVEATTDGTRGKVAAAAIATAVVALAASGGAWSALALNHNETLLRDRS